MSGKEISPYPYAPEPPPRLFPIDTYTKEIPHFSLPETQEYIETLEPTTQQLLSGVTENLYFLRNMSKLQETMWKESFSGEQIRCIEKSVRGFAFEIASHTIVSQELADEGYIVTSPEETHYLYLQTNLHRKNRSKVPTQPKPKLKYDESVSLFELYDKPILPVQLASRKPAFTEGDGIILRPTVDEKTGKPVTEIVGAAEYTTRANLGNFSKPYKYINRDKINQYRYHRNEKVLKDFFTSQPRRRRRGMQAVIHQQYPDIPNKLVIGNSDSYFSVFTVPEVGPTDTDVRIYPKKGRLIPIPITRVELDEFSENIVADLWHQYPTELWEFLNEKYQLDNLESMAAD